jgi:F0F1-type ATP synthase membrane subunit b/b'
MNPNLTPGPPEGQEPIEQLFRDVFELADETAQRITDTEVDARLDQLLRKNGRAAPPSPEPDPAKVLDAARRQAGKIVADAQRAAAETAAEAACAAQSAGEAARRQADLIMAEADGYSDTALSQAAEIVAGARSQAESIIADAREQARQILADARVQTARADNWEQQRTLTGTHVRDPYDCDVSPRLLAMMQHLADAGSDLADFHDRLPTSPASDGLHPLSKPVATALTTGIGSAAAAVVVLHVGHPTAGSATTAAIAGLVALIGGADTVARVIAPLTSPCRPGGAAKP